MDIKFKTISKMFNDIADKYPEHTWAIEQSFYPRFRVIRACIYYGTEIDRMQWIFTLWAGKHFRNVQETYDEIIKLLINIDANGIDVIKEMKEDISNDTV